MDTTGLLNQRTKIVLRRFHPQTPREIIRGTITNMDETGLRVSGRRFQELADLESGLPQERPIEADNKLYWIPFSSIRYSEILAPGSASEKLDNEIQRRKPFTPQELHRLSGSD
ncbi:MAG TPA: hypothetical protein VL171_10400 [Verrucomicrobiae bacterium]|nr:hypothetical protein [Verrucomicrobiae bacterium]